MKTLLVLPLAALAAIALTGPSAAGGRMTDEEKLAKAIEGRVAEAPVKCVNMRDLGGNKSAGETAIIFNGRTNKLIYVNRPAAGCPDLSFGRALQVRTTTTRLCRGDIVTVFDPLNGSQYGGCGLGEFTPYRRAR